MQRRLLWLVILGCVAGAAEQTCFKRASAHAQKGLLPPWIVPIIGDRSPGFPPRPDALGPSFKNPARNFTVPVNL